MNVAFCDGHGDFLRDDIDYAVYQQLMTPWGRKCVDAAKHDNEIAAGQTDLQIPQRPTAGGKRLEVIETSVRACHEQFTSRGDSNRRGSCCMLGQW